MSLRRVQVTDFRCLMSVELEFDPQFTLISGPNASGKTSLLEALFLLGRGRSFRTRRSERLIRTGSDRFVVFGEIDFPTRCVPVGVEGSANGLRAKMAGVLVPLAELASLFPVQIIDPEVHRLIEEGPNERRRFMDWGVFHVEHSFLKAWQSYQQVLRQRNAALRLRQTRSVVSAWDGELVRLAMLINDARYRYTDALVVAARPIVRRLLDLDLSLHYRTGWSQEASFIDALEQSWGRDQEISSTSVGPQRAELSIRLDGVPVKDRVSRGQQKLLASALLIAQVCLFPTDAIRPTLLLDDPAAELDGDRLVRLIHEVAGQSVQLVVTSLSANESPFGAPGRRFLIDSGVVRTR